MNEVQNQLSKMSTDEIIEKTILASLMDNGFWDRWMVHGIAGEFIDENKSKMSSLTGWTGTLSIKAEEYTNLGKKYKETGDFQLAEQNYRRAGIFYNLAQWVFPEPNGDRIEWYRLCLKQFDLADGLSNDKITHHSLIIDDKKYEGRVRVPNGNLAGVIIVIVPTDSTKEEFYTYEQDFAKQGFVVVSFDGTGQGETLIFNGHKADSKTWWQLVNGVIDFSIGHFPNLSINLFGISSGGAWAIEGSKHPQVAKTVVVSPPPKYESNIRLPDYFRERMGNLIVDFEKGCLPVFKNLDEISNILIFHGGKDLLINKNQLIELYEGFSPEKRFITYEDEGHCCNYKLDEIRIRASRWFKGANINEI